MRLTVGPLPPAVYWRRRAIVLGALVVVILFLYVSCGGTDGDGKTGASSSPTPTQPVPTQPEPTGTLLVPETGAPVGAGGEDPGGESQGPPPTGGAAPQAPAGDAPCTDDEMTITPVPAKTTISRGSAVDIRLKIENSGDRSCSRDVGADLQELRIVQGALTIWSSDRCGAQKGSDVRTFAPGGTREYGVTWNGKSSARCTSGVPSADSPPAGQYQLLARLGTKHSQPVVLTLRES